MAKENQEKKIKKSSQLGDRQTLLIKCSLLTADGSGVHFLSSTVEIAFWWNWVPAFFSPSWCCSIWAGLAKWTRTTFVVLFTYNRQFNVNISMWQYYCKNIGAHRDFSFYFYPGSACYKVCMVCPCQMLQQNRSFLVAVDDLSMRLPVVYSILHDLYLIEWALCTCFVGQFEQSNVQLKGKGEWREWGEWVRERKKYVYTQTHIPSIKSYFTAGRISEKKPLQTQAVSDWEWMRAKVADNGLWLLQTGLGRHWDRINNPVRLPVCFTVGHLYSYLLLIPFTHTFYLVPFTVTFYFSLEAAFPLTRLQWQ